MSKYYKNSSNIEAIDLIEAYKLNFNLGNAVKYISRCNYKGEKISDLRKAIWYLKKELRHECKTQKYSDNTHHCDNTHQCDK